MLALIKYSYDYYEWEIAIAVSKDKEKLEAEYCKIYPNPKDRDLFKLIDYDLHKKFSSREETHYCIEPIKYLE